MQNKDVCAKPTLLLIAHDFPPARGGGVQRPAKLCKYLQEDGWQIFVLTASPRKGTIDPHLDPGPVSLLRARPFPLHRLVAIISRLKPKVTTFWQRNRTRFYSSPRLKPPKETSPDTIKGDVSLGLVGLKVGWLLPALIEGYKLLGKQNVDIICATLPPATSALVGVLLHLLFHKPLVIDYRDPWTLYPDWQLNEYGKERTDHWTRMRLWVERHLERFILTCACGISLAGGTNLVDDFNALFPSIKREKYRHIPNGIDTEDWQSIKVTNVPSTKPFHLAFLGNYYWLHTPDSFLSGLRLFLDRSGIAADEFQVSFTGTFPDTSKELISKLQLVPYIKLTPEVSYTTSLETMLQANVLLVTLPQLRCSRHWVPGKLYEYLATGKPILAVLPEGAASELVQISGNGLVVRPEDNVSIANALEKLVTATFSVHDSSQHTTFLAQFERRNLAQRFDALLRDCLT